MDVLSKNVGALKKEFRKLPSADSALVSRVFGGISKKKTYDVLAWLDKMGRILPHLHHYVRYSDFTIADLTAELQRGESVFELFEILVITHLVHASTGERAFDFEKFFATTGDSHVDIPEPAITDAVWYSSVLDEVQTHGRTIAMEEYVETILIPSGPYGGSYYKHFRFPPGRQLYRWASPEDSTTVISHMWSIQLGKSTFVENVVIYYMKISPAEIMHAFATMDAAEKCAKKRISPRAQMEGIRFIARDWGEEQDGKARVSGNKVLSKEFFGGNYDAVTVGSTSQTASESKRIVVKEEIDREGWDKGGGKEGSQDVVIDARATSWGGRKKIFNVSSPNLVETSRIYQKFLAGTQHRYHCACPRCGETYHLEFGFTKDHGLQYSVVDGSVDHDSIYYRCPSCKGEWYEREKLDAMDEERGAGWVAGAKPVFKNHISTHMNQLYSVVATWKDVCEAHYKSVLDPSQEQEFWNGVLGLPYERKGTRPEASEFYKLKDSSYSSGEIPSDVLFLTGAIDVQRGSEHKKNNPAGLALEVLGHCDNFVTKSVEYLFIEGATDVVGKGAWEKLDDLFDSHAFMYRDSSGVEYAPVIWFIDAHDGMRTETVYQYCRKRGQRVYPSMGMAYIGSDPNADKNDKGSSGDLRRYKRVKVEDDLIVYQISTRYYKKRTYDSIRKTIEKFEEGEQFPTKVHFPSDYDDRYFEGLTAEEEHIDMSFSCKKGTRNEPLDVRVYNLAAADAWVQDLIYFLRGVAKKAGKSEDEVKSIDFRAAVAFLKKDRETKILKAKTTKE